MRDNDVVTFVTPVFVKNQNDLKFLEETILGMKAQTDSGWQAVIIDDCSPLEETRDILLKYQKHDSRIHVIFRESRITTGMCRNIGVEWANQANSPIILFNDADDISHPNRVEVVKRIFNSMEVVVVYSGFTVIDEYTKYVPTDRISEPILEILESIEKGPPHGSNCWYELGLVAGYTNITSSTAVRTELAIREPFPDELVSEDFHTWYRYSAHGDFYYTDEIPTLYRIPSYVVRQSSNSYVDDFNLVKSRVDWDGFSKALDIAMSKGILDETIRQLIEAKFLLRLAESMGRDGRFELAYKLAMQANDKLRDYRELKLKKSDR